MHYHFYIDFKSLNLFVEIIEMADSLLSEENVVLLEPFIHQVGGRSPILMYGQNVCKPINMRELAFYETLPQELKPFVPEFRGVIEVDFTENADGYLTITAKPPDSNSCDDKLSLCQQQTKYRIRLCKPYGDVVIESNDISLADKSDQIYDVIFEDGSNTCNNDLIKRTSIAMTKHNPWILKPFSSLRETENIKKRKFILLENLASKFKFPCVLDLKMGVRQYDDDASQSKKLSHSLKVNETTSGVLGLRITGIQVYSHKLDRFICHNKYYGRTLTPEGLKVALKKFLLNENYSKVDIITSLIKQLENLHSVIVKLETFRFYTSSLLILYEGYNDPVLETKSKVIDIRMIDFAHSTHQSMPIDKTDHRGPDLGYIFGLNNLIQLLNTINSEHNSE